MTAKEMFEEYGLKQETFKFKGKIISISYITKENFKPQVFFNLKLELYRVFFTDSIGHSENASSIDMVLHKAINKQIEELGWNNER